MVECRALRQRHCYRFVALLRLQTGVGGNRCRIAVPGGGALQLAGFHIIDKCLQFDVVGFDETVFPVGKDGCRQAGGFTHLHRRRFRQARNARFANDFALDVVAVLAIYEDFDVDQGALFRFKRDDLWVFQSSAGSVPVRSGSRHLAASAARPVRGSGCW